MAGTRINHRQEQAIAALLAEPSIEAAAGKAGVPGRTLKRWLGVQAFRDRYRAERLKVLERTVGRLVESTCQAVDVLRQALSSERVSDKVRAAQVILTFAYRGMEAMDMAAELEQVKAELAGLHHGKNNGYVAAGRAAGGEGGAAEEEG